MKKIFPKRTLTSRNYDWINNTPIESPPKTYGFCPLPTNLSKIEALQKEYASLKIKLEEVKSKLNSHGVVV